MNKTAQTEIHRTFLIERLPEPLTPASSHLQLFDNYIENTRIRLRSIRDPYTKSWTKILQQRFTPADSDPAITKLAEIYLNEEEYAVFERFEGREIRKNRYFHEFDGRMFEFDIYLGPLWGLCAAKVILQDIAEISEFEPPPFAVYEITGDNFFSGWSLVDRKFEDIQAEVAKLAARMPNRELPDE